MLDGSLPLVTTLSRGAGYTFGSGVVYKFLETNGMSHILRAHQLCMEGYASLFDGHLSTVWSAPNYCYRCGNSASILEVSPGEVMYFNVFQAAPENDRDGPSHQAIHNPGGTVRAQSVIRAPFPNPHPFHSFRSTSCKPPSPIQYICCIRNPPRERVTLQAPCPTRIIQTREALQSRTRRLEIIHDPR